jgi:hypothetical protein
MPDKYDPNEPGSITQEADNQDERISGISNVNRTISNMQRNVDTRLQEIDDEVGDSEAISEVQNSLRKVLASMSGTIGDIGRGFSNIAKTTAETTSQSIKQYSQAISQDISYNKQNIVAMALSRSTPIFGYFAAKFMETDVFKSAAERIKANIGDMLSGIGGRIKSAFTGRGKGEREATESGIPKMQKGGYVEKGGMAYLHPAEVVMPIEKVLEKIDESISVAQDLAKISKRAQLNTMAKLSTFVDEQKKFQKQGIIKGFINAYATVQSRYMEPSNMRMLRAVLSIQDTLGATVGTWPQVWQKLLVEHPTFRNIMFTLRGLYSTIALPARLTYALFKRRGGYEGHLSRDKSPMAATAYNVGLVYTGGMWRLDNIALFTRATAEATRDLSSAITGKRYPQLRGVGQGFFSLIGLGRTVLNFATKFTPALTGAFVDALTGGTGKKGWSIGMSIGESLTSETFITRLGEKIKMLIPSLRQEEGIYGAGGIVEALPGLHAEARKRGAIPVYDVTSQKLIEYQEEILSLTEVANKWNKKQFKSQAEEVDQTKELVKHEKRKLFFRLLSKGGGFIKSILGFIPSLLGGLGGGLFRMLGLGGLGAGLGGLLGGAGRGAGGIAKGIGGMVSSGFKTAAPKIKTVLSGVLSSPMVWKGGALAFAGFIGWEIGKWLDKLLGISEKFEKMQNKWDKASEELGKTVTDATRAAATAAREKGGAEGFAGKRTTALVAGMGKVSAERQQDIGSFGRRHIAGIEDAQRKFMMENINEYLKYGPEQVDMMRQRWLSEGGWIGKTWGGDHLKYGRMREKAFLSYLQTHGKSLSESELQKQYRAYEIGFAKEHPMLAAGIKGKELAAMAGEKGKEYLEAMKKGAGVASEKVVGVYTQATELAAAETRNLAANTKELRNTMEKYGEKAADATLRAGKNLETNLAQATNIVSNQVSQSTQRITNIGGDARKYFSAYSEAVIRGDTLEEY